MCLHILEMYLVNLYLDSLNVAMRYENQNQDEQF